MKQLFTPAINLMNKLSYSRKFIVLGGLALIALFIVATSLIYYLAGSIKTANLQLKGLTQAQKTSLLIQSLQQHRGLSSAVIAGVENSADKLLLINKQVNENFQKISDEFPSTLKNTKKWPIIINKWQYLDTYATTLDLDENFQLHTELIHKITSLQLRVADHYLLLVMDDLDSYYLTNSFLFTMPITLELLGKARGTGVSYLVNKNKTSQKNLLTLFANTTVPLDVFKDNIHKVKHTLISNEKHNSVQ